MKVLSDGVEMEWNVMEWLDWLVGQMEVMIDRWVDGTMNRRVIDETDGRAHACSEAVLYHTRSPRSAAHTAAKRWVQI